MRRVVGVPARPVRFRIARAGGADRHGARLRDDQARVGRGRVMCRQRLHVECRDVLGRVRHLQHREPHTNRIQQHERLVAFAAEVASARCHNPACLGRDLARVVRGEPGRRRMQYGVDSGGDSCGIATHTAEPTGDRGWATDPTSMAYLCAISARDCLS
jgi:hypothetical protein